LSGERGAKRFVETWTNVPGFSAHLTYLESSCDKPVEVHWMIDAGGVLEISRWCKPPVMQTKCGLDSITPTNRWLAPPANFPCPSGTKTPRSSPASTPRYIYEMQNASAALLRILPVRDMQKHVPPELTHAFGAKHKHAKATRLRHLIGALNYRKAERRFFERFQRGFRMTEGGDDIWQHCRKPVGMMRTGRQCALETNRLAAGV
jgi:hypothetical protein